METEKSEKESQDKLEASCQVVPPSERFSPANARLNRAIFVANRSRQVPMAPPRPEEARFPVNDNTSPPLFEMLEANISREKVVGELVAALGSSPEEKADLTRKFSVALGIPPKEAPKATFSPSQMRQAFPESQADLSYPPTTKIQELMLERATLLRLADRLTEQIKLLTGRI